MALSLSLTLLIMEKQKGFATVTFTNLETIPKIFPAFSFDPFAKLL